MATTADTMTRDYVIKDISLAEFGRDEIAIAETEMPGLMALRAELQELRTINERLARNIERLRGEHATDPNVLNKALVVELDALRAARASEAAELDRILADMDGAGAGEGGHA